MHFVFIILTHRAIQNTVKPVFWSYTSVNTNIDTDDDKSHGRIKCKNISLIQNPKINKWSGGKNDRNQNKFDQVLPKNIANM